MKILYHIPYPDSLDAGRFIYEGWRDAFLDLGHDVAVLSAQDNVKEKIMNVKPDIFLSAVNLHTSHEKSSIYPLLKESGVKILLWVDWPLKRDDLEILTTTDYVDVLFGEREQETMKAFEDATKKSYHLIANAANKKLHFPTASVKKYQYDIVYLGAWLPMKERFFKEVLFPLRAKYSVGIFGPGWTRKDFLLRLCARVCRKMKLYTLMKFFNTLRITIPIEEENALYSSAKIALNFHELDPNGGYSHLILNQRTFKIPACGGFELCDDVPVLRKYFADNEVVIAETKDDWGRLIEYYLTHESERKAIAAKGTARALRDHTYHNRVVQLLALCAA